MSDILGAKIGAKMKYGKIWMCMMALVCLAFQACAESDPLGESTSGSTMGSSGDYLSPNMGQAASSANPDEGLSGMVQWLDQPVSNNVAKSTATSTTPSPDAAKSTTTTTSTTPVTKPTSTTESTTTTSTTPGFEAAFAIAGILAVTLVSLRRRR